MNGNTFVSRRTVVAGVLGAGYFVTIARLTPVFGQDLLDQVKVSMAALKAETARLGTPRIEGSDPVAGRDVPALYFGTTKINNDVGVVDDVTRRYGGTATLFVKSGNDYVRVATNVKQDDGSRAMGTVLDPNGPVFRMIQKGQAYYGDTTILGKQYVTGYEPIRDASGDVIGIYYAGYFYVGYSNQG